MEGAEGGGAFSPTSGNLFPVVKFQKAILVEEMKKINLNLKYHMTTQENRVELSYSVLSGSEKFRMLYLT